MNPAFPFDRYEFAARFGRRLRAWRVERRLTQPVLAAQAGYSQQTISNLERGFTLPALGVVFVLAEVLEVHPRLLLFGEEDELHD